jgi:hypothetical protein
VDYLLLTPAWAFGGFGFGHRQEVVMVVPDAVNRALGNGRDPRIGVTVDV